jgi:hypothetical protein
MEWGSVMWRSQDWSGGDGILQGVEGLLLCGSPFSSRH